MTRKTPYSAESKAAGHRDSQKRRPPSCNSDQHPLSTHAAGGLPLASRHVQPVQSLHVGVAGLLLSQRGLLYGAAQQVARQEDVLPPNVVDPVLLRLL